MTGGLFPWRVFFRLLVVQAILVLAATGGSGLAARYFFKRQFVAQIETQLRDTVQSLVGVIPAKLPANWCADLGRNAQLRITLISREGLVLCDSHHDAGSMENHAGRPEIIEAQRSGFGQSIRMSQTTHIEMLYVARWLKDREVFLRGALPLDRLNGVVHVMDVSIAFFMTVLTFVLILFAGWAGRSLIVPMGRILEQARGLLDLKADAVVGERLNEESFGEWTELESAIVDMRRELEEKIEALTRERREQAALMSAISDAIIAVNHEGAPLFYNSRFALLFFGREQPIPESLWQVLRQPEILHAFKAATVEGRSETEQAIPLDQAEGRKFFSLSVSPLRGSGDQIYGAVGVFHDVTELKRAEQIRIDFVANVSHELRTPLTAIKGYTDTLLLDLNKGVAPERDFVEVIARNTERLMHLINDLLDLSTLESTDTLQKGLLDTTEITTRVVDQMKGVLEAKGLVVEILAQAAVMLGDARRVEQVLVNLLDNARKYSPNGAKIRISWSEAPDRMVTLKVADSGPGIPVEHQGRLFERFYRVDKARSRDLGGTGLGLAIVKHIMQRHGGSISVESEPGKGSTFVCRFPATSTNGEAVEKT